MVNSFVLLKDICVNNYLFGIIWLIKITRCKNIDYNFTLKCGFNFGDHLLEYRVFYNLATATLFSEDTSRSCLLQAEGQLGQECKCALD